jgi:hypothetical protein
MNNLSLIHKILARALLDIRIAAHEQNSKIAFDLSDLVHNVPLQLERELKGNTDFTETLNWIRMRAEQKKLTKWLDAVVAEYE